MMLYVSYHDGNHYNSVRSKTTGGPVSLLDGKVPAVVGDMGAETGDSGIEDDMNAVEPAAVKKGLCPCGSGRKFRKCCRKRKKLVQAAHEQLDHDTDEKTTSDIVTAMENIDI
jgi:hypothetical protein